MKATRGIINETEKEDPSQKDQLGHNPEGKNCGGRKNPWEDPGAG